MIDADFPGGNIVVDRVEGDGCYLRPDLRDTEGFWFYWNFRVRGCAGRSLTFHFTEGGDVSKKANIIGALGPAVSRDFGKSWQWLINSGPDDSAFPYSFASNENETRFCVAIPYVQHNLDLFKAIYSKNPYLSFHSLCETEKNRISEIVKIHDRHCKPPFRVLITCRHHACESMANYVLEGMIEEACSESKTGQYLRSRCEIMAIPFMDKDGVEEGDQGKNRRPHDHNRDYGAGGDWYAAVRALKKETFRMDALPIRIAVDLHCPWLYDRKQPGWNEKIYQVGLPSADMATTQCLFGALLEQTTRSLPYRAAGDLHYGSAWNMPRPDPEVKNCTEWFAALPGMVLATALEIPYARVEGVEVTPEKARGFGRELAKSLFKFIKQKGI